MTSGSTDVRERHEASGEPEPSGGAMDRPGKGSARPIEPAADHPLADAPPTDEPMSAEPLPIAEDGPGVGLSRPVDEAEEGGASGL